MESIISKNSATKTGKKIQKRMTDTRRLLSFLQLYKPAHSLHDSLTLQLQLFNKSDNRSAGLRPETAQTDKQNENRKDTERIRIERADSDDDQSASQQQSLKTSFIDVYTHRCTKTQRQNT
mmetsp:Transcript_1196/g.2495  ORF Transcript_1196/g.2495 Transcript_1196/m.2495 type:complete len:121 (-) Transcript_1196:2140-2502(-)